MFHHIKYTLLLCSLLLSPACGGEQSDGQATASPSASPTPWPDFEWDLPKGFPLPQVPDDNPMSTAKVELGRHLFYDTRLSGNETQSCASCHEQALAFTDGKARGEGSTGEFHPRSAMSLVNVGYSSVLTWANPLQTSLEEQALLPLFGEFPVELGLSGMEDELLTRLGEDLIYQGLFVAAFPGDNDPINLGNLTKALAAFERVLISGNSPYDQFIYQQDGALFSDAAYRGFQLFLSEKMECFHCHGGFNFSDSISHDATAIEQIFFHNTGLYNLDGNGSYPASDQGLIEITGLPEDMGRFKAPTLRNIGVTAPYMHDGSIDSLEDAILHYAAGGRTIESGENTGVGSENPIKSPFVPGFELSGSELEDLVAFLNALTDNEFLEDPRFSDPWQEQ